MISPPSCSSGSDADTLQYGPTRGYAPLLEAIVALSASAESRAASGRAADHQRIAAGHRSHRPRPGQPGRCRARRAADVHWRHRGVQERAGDSWSVFRRTPTGISLDASRRRLAARRGARARRSSSSTSFRTSRTRPGALLALDRAAAARSNGPTRRDVLIVEDDPYGSLYFEDVARRTRRARCARTTRDGRVLYLSTFSKTLAPGFRVGWMVAPPLAHRALRDRQAVDGSDVRHPRSASRLRGRAAAGSCTHSRRSFARSIARKRDVMEQALRATIGDRLTWSSPKGGFFIWATLPAWQFRSRVCSSARSRTGSSS